MRRKCEHGADQVCRCGTCYCSECFPGEECPDCRQGFTVGRVVRRFGAIRGLQVVGFCAAWRGLGLKFGDTPLYKLKKDLEAQGLSVRAAYRYISYLEEWNKELGRAPGEVDDLALRIALGGFLEGENEAHQPTLPMSASRATIP